MVSELYSHIKAFATKLFESHLSQNEINTSHFPALKEVMDCFPEETCGQEGKYAKVIESLFAEFNWPFKDFSIIEKDMHLFASPFAVDPVDAPHELQLELIELQCDDELHFCHQQFSQIDFYRQLNKEKFPNLRADFLCHELEQKPFEVQNYRCLSARCFAGCDHGCPARSRKCAAVQIAVPSISLI